jgi:ATP-dependent metalloprotease FtsH
MNKEFTLGLALALLAFLAIEGVNVLPWLFVGGSFLILMLMLGSRGLAARFQVVPEGAGADGEISFSDIGGQDVAKREFREALDFIIQQEKTAQLGIRPLRGILLSGPPGTGKTLLAKAAARYTAAVFLAASGSQFVEMYAGVGAQRVRELFSRARSQAVASGKQNAVIFIDEIEVLGGKRGQHSSHLEYDQTLNELLVQMDGLATPQDVRLLIVGATNRADLLDPALLRPGRFDRIVKVDLPDSAGRLSILKIHTQGKPLAEDVDLESLARESYGFSGAHLESLTNEAAIGALRAGKGKIEMEDFREAMDKVIMGEKLPRRPSESERRRIAYHELGHAIIAELVEKGSVAVVTITSRGQALGYTRQAPPPDRYLYTEKALRGQIWICLAGALAEELMLGERSTGASGDYRKAVELAKRMIQAGFSPLGIVSLEDVPPSVLQRTVSKLLENEQRQVAAKLADYQELIGQLGSVLLEQEKMQGQTLRERLALRKAS